MSRTLQAGTFVGSGTDLQPCVERDAPRDPGTALSVEVHATCRLDRLEVRELPEATGVRNMVGVSVLLLAVGLGSGEFIMWPNLVARYGYAILWGALAGCITQYVVNMEIARYAMASGETVVTGFARLHPVWPWVFLIANIICWMWPGWATGSSSCLVFLVGGNPLYYSLGGLVGAGLLLSLGRVVYRTLNIVQSVLVSIALVFLVIVAIEVVDGNAVLGVLSGALTVGFIPPGVDVPVLVTAIAFAGAGGTLNLCHANYVREHKYAMGKYIGRLISPLTGEEEPIASTGFAFECNGRNLKRWHHWFLCANVEHFITFCLLTLLSIGLMAAVAFTTLHGRPVRDGMGFIDDMASIIGGHVGPWARFMFLFIGCAFLYTTCLGILDATSRLSADIIKVNVRRVRDSAWWTQSKLYLVFLWFEIVLGVAILCLGLRQPMMLLTVSGSLGIGVMCLYTTILMYMNSGRLLSRPVSMSWWRFGAMVWAACFYGAFALLVVWAVRG